MSKRRRTKPSMLEQHKPLLIKVGAVLLTGAGTTGTVVGYEKAASAEVQMAEMKKDISHLDAGSRDIKEHVDAHDKYIRRLDKRTTRMEAMQEMQLQRQGIKPPPKSDE